MGACSTKKNTFTSRTYHNVVSKYNVYFNGKESFEKGKHRIEESFEDNYTAVLPIFQYGDKTNNESASADMDKTIVKCSKVIKRHSITVKPKQKKGRNPSKSQKKFHAQNEFCKWVDDSHLLMGKAHFYKHRFDNAEKSFNYVINEYGYSDIKYPAILWLARTHNENKNFMKSESTLEFLVNDRKMPKKYKADFATTYADFHLKQGQWEDAVMHLKVAIKYTRKKNLKARYKFILAQVYQKLEEYKEASDLYEEVSKINNASYEMIFNAKINRAVSFDVGLSNSKEIKTQLVKMLSDEKNKDFRDQIYYALANLSYKEKDENQAIIYYKHSILENTSNNNQKAVSYLSLADIYFEKPKYQLSQAYYDSSMTYLNKNYYDYEKLELKTKNLTELVKYDNIVNFQDSMQTLAKMSEADRNQAIEDIIEKVIQEEQEAKLATQRASQRSTNDMYFDPSRSNSRMPGGNNNRGKWYFYNPQSLQFGENEFNRKWGERKLEDNWRRQNKAVVQSEKEEDEDDILNDEPTLAITDNKTKEYYLQLIPLTDSAMLVSNKKLERALYKVGKTYKNKLFDYEEAIQSFEKLNIKYPDGEYKLSAFFNIYQSYKSLNDNTNCNFYKNKIIEEYPKSKYAKMFTNPNFWADLQKDEKVVHDLYEEIFNLYEKKQYNLLIQKYKTVKQEYPDTELMPKFDFLNALAVGKTSNNEKLKILLKEIIKNYPDSEVKQPAINMISYLENDALTDEQRGDELYKLKANEYHYYFVLVENNKKIDINRLKFDFYDFNSNYNNEVDFKVNSNDFTEKYKMITVESFDNKSDAMNYLRSSKDKKVFKNLDKSKYKEFIISIENYQTFKDDKVTSTYIAFFQKYYN